MLVDEQSHYKHVDTLRLVQVNCGEVNEDLTQIPPPFAPQADQKIVDAVASLQSASNLKHGATATKQHYEYGLKHAPENADSGNAARPDHKGYGRDAPAPGSATHGNIALRTLRRMLVRRPNGGISRPRPGSSC